VNERFPFAVQAWLAGSTVSGTPTETSDLDITVLLPDTGVAHRESLIFRGWPVEVFVNTEASIRHFVEIDRARRRPTMARLVATGTPLLPGSGGEAIRAECAARLQAGPGGVSKADLDTKQYRLTDLIDDLRGSTEGGPVHDAIVAEVWRSTAEFVLAARQWWSGGGKWLMRELVSLDAHHRTAYAHRLHLALHQAINGDSRLLVQVSEDALAEHGGRLWSGYRLDA
jgi:hypothetical protein